MIFCYEIWYKCFSFVDSAFGGDDGEGVCDRLEHGGEICANRGNSADNNDGDQSGDQAVLHGGDTTAVPGNGLQRLGEGGGAQDEVVHNLTLSKGLF
jgi:hypothetical protein